MRKNKKTTKRVLQQLPKESDQNALKMLDEEKNRGRFSSSQIARKQVNSILNKMIPIDDELPNADFYIKEGAKLWERNSQKFISWIW